MGYTDTFIVVAPDCPAAGGEAPPARADTPTVARVEYTLLVDAPYQLTQEDVQFETWLRRQKQPVLDHARARLDFFAKSRACLRGSPLPKRYGWALHYDGDGRIALYGKETVDYVHRRDEAATVLTAFRNARPPKS